MRLAYPGHASLGNRVSAYSFFSAQPFFRSSKHGGTAKNIDFENTRNLFQKA